MWGKKRQQQTKKKATDLYLSGAIWYGTYISLTHWQYYTYVYCYIHELAHRRCIRATIVSLK